MTKVYFLLLLATGERGSKISSGRFGLDEKRFHQRRGSCLAGDILNSSRRARRTYSKCGHGKFQQRLKTKPSRTPFSGLLAENLCKGICRHV